MVDSMKDLFNKPGGDPSSQALRELAKEFPELQEALKALDHQIEENDKALQNFDKEVKEAATSADELTEAHERLTQVGMALAEALESITKGQFMTAKAAKKLAKETTGLAKVNAKERKAATDGLKKKQQQRDARGRFGAGNGGGGGGGGKKDKDEEDKDKEKKKDGFIRRNARKGAEHLAEDNSVTKAIGEMGTPGLIAGAILGGLTKILRKQREGVVSATQRTLNYGTSRSQNGKTGDNVSAEITSANEGLLAAGEAAVKFNGDLEATKAALVKIGTETGNSWDKLTKSVEGTQSGVATTGSGQ